MATAKKENEGMTTAEGTAEKKVKRWICKICGFIYEGESLPDDYICPICKHGAEDFEPLD